MRADLEVVRVERSVAPLADDGLRLGRPEGERLGIEVLGEGRVDLVGAGRGGGLGDGLELIDELLDRLRGDGLRGGVRRADGGSADAAASGSSDWSAGGRSSFMPRMLAQGVPVVESPDGHSHSIVAGGLELMS